MKTAIIATAIPSSRKSCVAAALGSNKISHPPLLPNNTTLLDTFDTRNKNQVAISAIWWR
jgi:hypothetical protein